MINRVITSLLSVVFRCIVGLKLLLGEATYRTKSYISIIAQEDSGYLAVRSLNCES